MIFVKIFSVHICTFIHSHINKGECDSPLHVQSTDYTNLALASSVN
ncbi:hypothetical protein [Moraxella lacunata]